MAIATMDKYFILCARKGECITNLCCRCLLNIISCLNFQISSLLQQLIHPFPQYPQKWHCFRNAETCDIWNKLLSVPLKSWTAFLALAQGLNSFCMTAEWTCRVHHTCERWISCLMNDKITLFLWHGESDASCGKSSWWRWWCGWVYIGCKKRGLSLSRSRGHVLVLLQPRDVSANNRKIDTFLLFIYLYIRWRPIMCHGRAESMQVFIPTNRYTSWFYF